MKVRQHLNALKGEGARGLKNVWSKHWWILGLPVLQAAHMQAASAEGAEAPEREALNFTRRSTQSFKLSSLGGGYFRGTGWRGFLAPYGTVRGLQTSGALPAGSGEGAGFGKMRQAGLDARLSVPFQQRLSSLWLAQGQCAFPCAGDVPPRAFGEISWRSLAPLSLLAIHRRSIYHPGRSFTFGGHAIFDFYTPHQEGSKGFLTKPLGYFGGQAHYQHSPEFSVYLIGTLGLFGGFEADSSSENPSRTIAKSKSSSPFASPCFNHWVKGELPNRGRGSEGPLSWRPRFDPDCHRVAPPSFLRLGGQAELGGLTSRKGFFTRLLGYMEFNLGSRGGMEHKDWGAIIPAVDALGVEEALALAQQKQLQNSGQDDASGGKSGLTRWGFRKGIEVRICPALRLKLGLDSSVSQTGQANPFARLLAKLLLGAFQFELQYRYRSDLPARTQLSLSVDRMVRWQSAAARRVDMFEQLDARLAVPAIGKSKRVNLQPQEEQRDMLQRELRRLLSLGGCDGFRAP